MRVAKWGNSLAVRLPASVVDDEIEIYIADEHQFGVSRKPRREELLKRLRAFRGRFRLISSSSGTRRMPGSFLDTKYCCISRPVIPPKPHRGLPLNDSYP
jgi:antitoxin MazE